VLLYIAGATSTIGWLIGAGSVIIASHGTIQCRFLSLHSFSNTRLFSLKKKKNVAALTEPVAEPSTSVEGEFI